MAYPLGCPRREMFGVKKTDGSPAYSRPPRFSKGDIDGPVARSDFARPHGLMWLAFPVTLGLGNAGFAPFLKFDQPAWRHPISPEAPWGTLRGSTTP